LGPGQDTRIDGLEPVIVVRDALSIEVTRQLLTYLFSGKVPVGGRLPSERELAAQLGIARNAVRDGLRPLALLGVVESRPGSGTYLRAKTSELLPEVIEWGLLLNEQSLSELVEARLYVETALVRLTSLRSDEETLAALRSELSKMEAARKKNRAKDFAAADLSFHLRIAEGANNSVLSGILRNIRILIAAWIERVVTTTSDLDGLYSEHEAIMTAIDMRDGDSAADAMETHLRVVTRRLFEELNGYSPTGLFS
jgi:GntR family transcriptional regulator, transcriptional repressor for pyruvate dehydrogenase complex